MSEPWAQNTLGLDFRAEAELLGEPAEPIVDVHTHINGGKAAEIWADAASRFGVSMTYTQTVLEEAPGVRDALGDRARFIAIPDYMAEDKKYAFTEGYIERIKIWHGEYGARMLKFWQAPRLRDYMNDQDAIDAMALDGPWKRKAVELANELGMMIMTHIADPDTWFATKYADASVYGTKAQQYEPLERMLDAYPETQWLAAHMGGYPENLDFLDGLLERHDNLSLDTSACKWQVRELSKQPREKMLEFLERWKGRILFGSDIVARD
ncbi:MAG: amidohydrolase family protein, partial [Phycisphaerales bacterium JB061]